MAEAIRATSVFPEDFIGRIEIAEHSGTDAESIGHLAREYDERARTAVKMLAGAATILIRTFVILVFVFLILRGAMAYIGMINDAGQPINVRARR